MCLQFCALKGGFLAEINDSEEQSKVSEFLSVHQFHWIGLNDMKTQQSWEWETSGTPAKFKKWAENEPNSVGTCVALNAEASWFAVKNGCFEKQSSSGQYYFHALCEAPNN